MQPSPLQRINRLRGSQADSFPYICDTRYKTQRFTTVMVTARQHAIGRAIGSITQVSNILLPTVKSTRQTLLYIAGLESQHQSDAVSYTIASNSEGSL